jgi:hypothetical protein
MLPPSGGGWGSSSGVASFLQRRPQGVGGGRAWVFAIPHSPRRVRDLIAVLGETPEQACPCQTRPNSAVTFQEIINSL